MFYVQGLLINTEEALDSVDWNPMCIHSIWIPLLTLNWYLIEFWMHCHHFQVYHICTVSIIIIFTTDNFVNKSGVRNAPLWCNYNTAGVSY